MLQGRPILIVIQLLPNGSSVTVEYLDVLLAGRVVKFRPRRIIRQHVGLERNLGLSFGRR
jgi:hypothetical protein